MQQAMRAVIVKQPGGPEQLAIASLAVPERGDNQVLIRVTAAGINRADIHQRNGNYPPPPGASEILGMEVSGHIVDAGKTVTRWKPGDRVCALLAGGGYAEYCTVPCAQCLPVPQSLSLVEAAGLPEAAFTVWANLFHQPLVLAGETLLIQGGASGIGTVAIQAAHALSVRAAATADSEEKLALCRSLGAEQAFSYKQDWLAQAKAWVGGAGVNVILDMIGGDYFPQHIDLLAPRGRLAHIAYARGAEVTLDLRKVMQKRLVITGSTLRSRSVGEKADLRDALEAKLWPFVLAGSIRPIIDRTFPSEQAAEAHRYFESGQHAGKVLLTTGVWNEKPRHQGRVLTQNIVILSAAKDLRLQPYALNDDPHPQVLFVFGFSNLNPAASSVST
jgi:NADPH2:quinone reductase